MNKTFAFDSILYFKTFIMSQSSSSPSIYGQLFNWEKKEIFSKKIVSAKHLGDKVFSVRYADVLDRVVRTRNEGAINRVFTVAYYKSLLSSFEENKFTWQCQSQRVDFDVCLKRNFRLIRMEPMLHYLDYCGRWPSALYEKIFISKIKFVHRVASRKTEKNRKHAVKYANRFVWLRRLDAVDARRVKYVVYNDDDEEEYIPRTPVAHIERDEDWFNPQVFAPFEEKVKSRNVGFLVALRQKIAALGDMRLPRYHRGFLKPNKIFKQIFEHTSVDEELEMVPIYNPCSVELGIEPQMDNATDCGFGVVQVDKSSNVVLTNQTTSKLEIPLDQEIINDFWVKASTSDGVYQDLHTADRWTLLDNFKWSKDDPEHFIIKQYDLPIDFIKRNLDSPNTMLFKQHVMWKGDIHIKIHLNSNQFQVGQLIVGWYYYKNFDKNYLQRMNRYSLYQLPHLLISASDSNDIEMVIPFRSYKSMLSAVPRDDESNSLDMGSLVVMVNNRLAVTSNSYTTIHGMIYVKFPNSNFSGLVPRNIVRPEMMSIKKVVNLASDSFDMFIPDPNRDNPAIIAPPMWMIPQASQNWSTGRNDAETVQAMRLEPGCMTPHPSGSTPNYIETPLNFLIQQYGFLQTLDWNKDHLNGAFLTSIDAHPSLPFSSYPEIAGYTGLRVLPPVAHLANFNCYWRGNLTLRLDFVSSNLQTGSLLVAYIPRTLRTIRSISDLKNCYHTVIDLSFSKRFEFDIPYIADKPWWPRRERHIKDYATSVKAPGQVVIVVMNPLALMDNVPPSVRINILIKGNQNFEVSVPVAPTIGPQYTIPINPPSDWLITTKTGYLDRVIFGWWHALPTNTKGIFRYGETSDHILQFDGPLHSFGIYQIHSSSAVKNLYAWVTKPTSSSNSVRADASLELKYFVRVIVDDSDTYNYMSGFDTLVKAEAYVKEWRKTGYDKNSPNSMLLDISKDYDHDPPGVLVFSQVVAIEPQMDADDPCVRVSVDRGRLASTLSGRMTFGEAFTDVIDYMRRYQLYSSHTIDVESCFSGSFLSHDLVMPITPIGLQLDQNVLATKYSRGGLIPYILSAYRFARGGLRFRIHVICEKPVTVYVQHRPDVIMAKREAFILKKIDGNPENVINSGYSLVVVNTQINPICSFEVPFYNPANLLLLQAPNLEKKAESLHFSMGDLCFSINSAYPKQQVQINLFYCIGDDFRPSCYIGFPPVSQIVVPKLIADDFEVIEPEMFSWFNNKKEEIYEDAANAVTEKVKDKLAVEAEEIKSGIFAHTFDLIKNFAADKKQVILNAITNLIHVILNPNMKTFCVSLVSFFSSIGMVCFSMIDKVIESCSKFFPKIFRATANETEGAALVQPEANDEETSVNDKSAFLSTLISAIAGALMVKVNWSKVKSIPDFTSNLLYGIKNFSMTANSLCQFFKNNLLMLQKCFYWTLRKFGLGSSVHGMIANDQVMFNKFVTDCQFLLDPSNAEQLKTNSGMIMRVYCCAVLAQAITRKFVVSENLDGKFLRGKHATLNLCRDIIKKRDELVTNKFSPPVSFEPFVVCQVGSGGIGKTHITNETAVKMLQNIKYKTDGEVIYTRTPNNQYWNGCLNQPVCVYDDFLQIEAAPAGLLDISELMILKSKAVFNPPQAAIPDKGIRYNPLIVFLNMNKAFPRIPGIANEESWMRRRDVLVSVKVLQQYEGMIAEEIPAEVLANNGHLLFDIHKYSRKQSEDMLQKNLNFEQYVTYLNDRFAKYYVKESKFYLDRCAQLAKFSFDESDDLSVILNEYSTYIDKINFNQLSALDKKELLELNQVAPLEVKQIIKGTVDSCHSIEKNFLSFCFDNKAKSSNITQQMRELVVQGEAPSGTTCSVLLMHKQYVDKDMFIAMQHHSNACTMTFLPTKDNKIKVFCSAHNTNSICEQLTPANKLYPVILRLEAEYVEQNTLVLPTSSNVSLDAVENQECPHKYFNSVMFYSVNLRKYIMDYVEDKSIIPLLPPEEFSGFMSVEDLDNGDYRVVPYNMCKSPLCAWKVKTPVDKDSFTTKFDRDMNAWKVMNLHYFSVSKIDWTCVPPYFKTCTRSYKVISKSIYDMCTPEIHKQAEETWYGKLGLWAKWLFEKCKWIVGSIIGTYLVAIGFFKVDEYLAKRAPNVSYSGLANGAINRMINPKAVAEMAYDQAVPKQYRRTTLFPKESKLLPPIVVRPEMATEQENVLLKKIKRNTFWITSVSVEGKFRTMRCLGLRGHYFLMLDHYHQSNLLSYKDSVFYYQTQNARIQFNYNELKFKAVMDSALLICKFPPQVELFKDIVGLFMRRDQSAVIPAQGFLYEISPPDKIFEEVSVTKFLLNLRVRDRLEIPSEFPEYESTIVDRVLTYSESRKGLCGSVLVGDLNCPNPILGIHVAGVRGGGCGFAEAIIQETIDAPTASTISYGEEVWAESGSISKAKIMIYSQVDPLYTVPPRLAHNSPGSSKLRKSVCYELISESKYDVPVLHKNDSRIQENPFSPIAVGCSFHGYVTSPFPDAIFKPALEDLRELIFSKVKPARASVGVLSESDAVCGIEVDGYDSIDFNKSEGFPFISYRPSNASNKKWLFDVDEKCGLVLNGFHPMLRKVLDEKHESRVAGLVPLTIFINCLKDQKLRKDKVLKPGKTRIFGIAPVDFSIQSRQYFLDFIVSYQNARFDVEHAVGINKDSIEWTQMIRELLNVSPCIVTGDYSKFGPTLMSKCVNAAFDIMIDWYELHGDTNIINRKVRECMKYEHMFAKHLMLNLVYRTFCGQPCGTTFTTILNGLVNKLYIRCAFAFIMDPRSKIVTDKINGEFIGMSSFRKYVKLITYGDDLIMAVDRNLVKYFNASTISKFFQRFYITFTDSLKNESTVPYASVFDPNTTFLKSANKLHPCRKGVFIHQLDPEVVYETCNWIMKSRNDEEMSVQSCQAMMLSAFGLGKDEYSEMRSKVLKFWGERGLTVVIPTWREEDERMFYEDVPDFDKPFFKSLLTYSSDIVASAKNFSLGKN